MSLVEENGGTYSRSFVLSQVTHLVCANPQGDKYELARQHPNIFIVKPHWIFESVEQRGWNPFIIFYNSNYDYSNRR